MDYLYAKFGNFNFSHFDFFSCGQTDRQTESEADDRYTHATTVGLITRYSLSAMASCTGSEQTSISLHFAQQ